MPLLRISGLEKAYAPRRSLSDRLLRRPVNRVAALTDISLSVAPHETLGLVGESGSGKTTLARSITRIVEPDAGVVELCGTNLLELSGRELAHARRRVQMVFQDPYTSLNPAMTVAAAIAEPALVHGLVRKAGARARVEQLMDQVGLPATLASRRPRELSGGQRQRVAIARSLAAEPEVLIADEAVSALDVSIQVQVLRLFARLREELGLTLILVSHQLATVAQLCDRVAIMHRGRIVEIGPTREVFADPRHQYTAALIEAHPGERGPRERRGRRSPLARSERP